MNPQIIARLLKFCQSGEISPNLVTLIGRQIEEGERGKRNVNGSAENWHEKDFGFRIVK